MNPEKKPMNWVSIVFLTIAAIIVFMVLVSVVVGFVDAVGKDTVGADSKNSSDATMFADAYMKGCMIDESFKSYCQCTIDELQSKYSTDELMDFADEYDKTDKLPEEFMSVIEGCMDKLNVEDLRNI